MLGALSWMISPAASRRRQCQQSHRAQIPVSLKLIRIESGMDFESEELELCSVVCKVCSFFSSRYSRPNSIKTLLPARNIRLLSGSSIKSRLLVYKSTSKHLHLLVNQALFVSSSIPLYSLLLSATLTRYPYPSHCLLWPPSNPHLDRLPSKDPIIK